MKKFKGTINGKTYSDEAVFRLAAAEAIKAGNYDIHTEFVESNEECQCSKNIGGLTPSVFDIAKAFKAAEDQDAFLDKLDEAFSANIELFEDTIRDSKDEKTTDAIISDVIEAAEQRYKELKEQQTINEKNLTALDDKLSKLDGEIQKLYDEKFDIIDEINREEDNQECMEIIEDYYNELLGYEVEAPCEAPCEECKCKKDKNPLEELFNMYKDIFKA